ncbi:hypothetical protein [uncultured Roseobacter sp.]|nr:hypothetical protein [uncultured Roseobacter sp.]
MTNRIALVLGLVLLGLVAIDVMVFGMDHVVFVGRKLLALIDYVAFWR